MALQTESDLYVSTHITLPEGDEIDLFDLIASDTRDPLYYLLLQEAFDAGFDNVDTYLEH